MTPRGERPRTEDLPEDARRTALAMVRAWWQGDLEDWDAMWAAAGDDRADVARALTALSEQLVERLALVAGLSTGEMLHRLVTFAVPRLDLTLHEPAPAGGPARADGPASSEGSVRSDGRTQAATLDLRTSRTGGRVGWGSPPAEESPDSTGQGGG